MKKEKIVDNMPITEIDIDVTNNCMLNCDYCFRGEKDSRRLSWETGTRAINWLIQQSQNKTDLRIAFFGGEPLMEFKLIKKLVPYAEQKATYYGKRVHFDVTTNCVLVNNEVIDFFRKHDMKLFASIDGCPESHDKHRHFPDGSGTSAIIEPKIRKILKYWPNTSASMSVCNDVVDKWMESVLYLVSLGYRNLTMRLVPECEWTDEQLNCLRYELRKISNFYIKRYQTGCPIFIWDIDRVLCKIENPSRSIKPCEAGRYSVSMKTDGTLYPCHTFGNGLYLDSDDEWRLGSIFEGIDQDKHNILINFDCISHSKGDCENCLAVHTCKFPCIALNWLCSHDIYKPHPNQCKFNNMYFVEAMRVHYILKSEKNPLFIKGFYSNNEGIKIKNYKQDYRISRS